MEPNELVTKLCWLKAKDGERFFDPVITAMECVQTFIESNADYNDGQLERMLYKEYGVHAEQWLIAVDFFEMLNTYGFDPVYRAESYAAQNDLEPVDWGWLNESLFDVKL